MRAREIERELEVARTGGGITNKKIGTAISNSYKPNRHLRRPLGIADIESRSLPCLNLKLDCHTRQGAEPRCSTSSRSSNGVQYSQ